MKKPVVDYRELRLSNINEPRFRHVQLLWGWIVYFLLYFLTERLIPEERCAVVHCRLDDLIPFVEYFAVAYCFWFALLFFTLLYYFLYDVRRFRELQIFIIVTQAVAMICYIFFPTCQDLRPEEFARDNIFTHVMAFIYAFDTNTGVCPSLHVAYSLGIVSVCCKKEDAPKLFKAFVVAAVILICMSVCFVKQHSAVDVVAALPVCLLAEAIVYGKSYWAPKLKRCRTENR